MNNSKIEYQVRIDNHEIVDKKVYYVIVVQSIFNSRQTLKRYSDLKALNERLQQKILDYKVNHQLPCFPGRKFFGRTNESPEGIKCRGKELQMYLHQVLNSEKLQPFQVIKEFLPIEMDESIRPNISDGQLLENQSSEYSKQKCWNQMDELKRSFLEKEERKFNKAHKKHGSIRSTQQMHLSTSEQRYTFSADDYTFEGGHVIYSITANDAKKDTKWKFTARYSDLREYHQLMKKRKLKTPLPTFPKRKLLGQTNENPLQIQERQEQLQQYLNSLFGVKEFEQSEILVFFIAKIKIEGVSYAKKANEQRSIKTKQMLEMRSSGSPNYMDSQPFTVNSSGSPGTCDQIKESRNLSF